MRFAFPPYGPTVLSSTPNQLRGVQLFRCKIIDILRRCHYLNGVPWGRAIKAIQLVKEPFRAAFVGHGPVSSGMIHY